MNIEKLKKLMEEQGVNQVRLSEVAGVSQAFISYVLKGYKVLSVAQLKRVADFLGVKVDYFLE